MRGCRRSQPLGPAAVPRPLRSGAATDRRARRRPVGFMDESMHHWELWPDRIARELATCRVFVPLYSPRYFNSVPCGQEWYTFTRRQVYAVDRESERTSAIVPVLWAPMNRYRLPEVAGELQFDHAGFGPAYVSEGLFALMKLSYYRSAYELAVHRLARRIVEVAEETVVPVGRTLDLNAQPSAFEPVRRSVRELRVLVLSCRRDELPAGPSPTAYGPQRTDWNPYGSTLGRSLAEHTAGLLRGMGFEPTVHDLVSEGEQLLGGVTHLLAVLLLDRWALLDAERIALLRRLDRRNHKVVAVLEPGSPDDPGDTAAGAELAELSRSALAAGGFLPAGRPRANRLPVLGSLSAFEDALAGVATAARRAVENRWPDGPRRGPDGEEGGSPGRPRADRRPARACPEGRPGRAGSAGRGAGHVDGVAADLHRVEHVRDHLQRLRRRLVQTGRQPDHRDGVVHLDGPVTHQLTGATAHGTGLVQLGVDRRQGGTDHLLRLRPIGDQGDGDQAATVGQGGERRTALPWPAQYTPGSSG
ncbi:TIR-like protein FxsC [Kitasatospora aburaviensis]